MKINLKTAHDSYEAWHEGVHDDLVLSVALASWTAGQYYSCAEKRAYQRDIKERLDQEFESFIWRVEQALASGQSRLEASLL